MKAFDKGSSGCGICAGKVVRPETSLATLAPWLAEEWLESANLESPNAVAPQSNDLFTWKCPVADDHVWPASPNNRYGKGSGCPFCSPSGQRASSTNNVTLVPRLMELWDTVKNEPVGLFPQDLPVGSKKAVWWKCPRGLHKSEKHAVWKETLKPLCGGCAGHVVSATNSLAENAPHLVFELDVIRTGRTADQISCGENGDVSWRCPIFPRTHRWEASPLNRVRGGTGCPDCMTPGVSAQEVRLAYELAAVLGFDPTRHSVRGDRSHRVDMVATELGLLLEFDGSYWHKGSEVADERKASELRHKGWVVVRIRESPLEVLDHTYDVVVPMLAPPYDAALTVLEHLAGIVGPSGAPLARESEVDLYRLRGIPVAAVDAEEQIRSIRARVISSKSLRYEPS
ncbi:unannotated protein [freshwater metagenome]|uniref:Unannotated protein n=1 Tax=freshwater metagenome TaxID=449393 RepID=A0A6J7JYZ3_9ZZZZ